MNFREQLVRAIEAVEDGDLTFARAVLRHAIETFDGTPIGPNLRCPGCPECGLGPLWPGELDDHLRFVHDQERAA